MWLGRKGTGAMTYALRYLLRALNLLWHGAAREHMGMALHVDEDVAPE